MVISTNCIGIIPLVKFFGEFAHRAVKELCLAFGGRGDYPNIIFGVKYYIYILYGFFFWQITCNISHW